MIYFFKHSRDVGKLSVLAWRASSQIMYVLNMHMLESSQMATGLALPKSSFLIHYGHVRTISLLFDYSDCCAIE